MIHPHKKINNRYVHERAKTIVAVYADRQTRYRGHFYRPARLCLSSTYATVWVYCFGYKVIT